MSEQTAAILREIFRFDAKPAVTEWLEKNIVLPREMSPRTPGPFSTRARPMMRPILECWHPGSGVRNCTVTAGTQMLKTTIQVLGVVYRIKYSPLPTLLVGPSEHWAQRELSERRLHPLINQNAVLRREKPYNPDAFKKLSMEMAGAPITIVGANSPTSLAGSTQGIVAIDEASKIEHLEREDAPEAHPIKNAMERTKDFAGIDFHYLSSTPNSPHHLFWETYEAGDQTHFYVPCPHCGNYFRFEFEEEKAAAALTPDEAGAILDGSAPKGYRSVVWSPDARLADGSWSAEKVIESARYICPHNGCEIQDIDKPAMIAAYEERRLNETAPKTDRSFRAPSFYSPTIRFGDMALKFLDRGDLFNTGLQAFYNSWLALPWERLQVNIKDEDVWQCRAQGDLSYLKGTIPVKPVAISLAADPGQAQTHWSAAVIDGSDNVWLVDWGTVLSIDDLPKLAPQLQWPLKANRETRYRPQIGLCDSGDWTEKVYNMCARSGGFWWPTKGSDASFGGWSKAQVKTHPKLALYTYVDKTAKDDLYDYRIKQKKTPGIFFPTDAGADLIHGHSGQQRSEAGVQSKWKKIAWDHYGDCTKLHVVLSWVLRSLRTGGAGDAVDSAKSASDATGTG